MEKILCAAIVNFVNSVWYKETATAAFLPINIDKGTVVCGFRHPHCTEFTKFTIHTLVALTGKRSVIAEIGEYVNGFLTDSNRFVVSRGLGDSG